MHLLEEITVIATVSVLVTLILGRLKLPVVAGLVLSGALVGPKALSLAHDPEAIEIIAEVGVIFLLFTIGLEFSLARLKNIFRQVALGGLLQVSVTALVTSAVCLGLDLSLPEAIVYGFVFALSSTALVLRTLGGTGGTGRPSRPLYCGHAHLSGPLHRTDGADRAPPFAGTHRTGNLESDRNRSE